MLSLAVAIGIGRFAFTPLMPMMLHERLLDLATASWLASANYTGYLIGALACMLQPIVWAQRKWPPVVSAVLVRAALLGTCLLTALMAVDHSAAWPLLRFFAGIMSAVAFVFTSSWCLTHLARLNAPTAGGLIYAGPGIGITVSGLLAGAMGQAGWPAYLGWLAFALLALIATTLIWPLLRGADASAPAIARHAPTIQRGGSHLEKASLALAYGLSGFGYIITATFLPVIARTALPGSAWLDFFWPLVGAAVACGGWLATRVPSHVDLRLLLAGCYLMQAGGVVLSNWWPSLAGFALGSLLVGLPFTAITFFGMQLGRRLHPQSASSMIGLLTASFGICQIAGPPVAAFLLARADSHAQGFTWALYLAASALLAGAVIYLMMVKAFAAHR